MNRKKRTEELIAYLKQIRDDSGYATVDVNLKDVELYNPIGMNNGRDLNQDIYDYIESRTNIVPANIPLKIRFHGDVSADEQDNIRQMIHRHYTLKSLDISWDLAANFWKTLALALFGACVLALYFYFTFASDHVLFTEILSIVGTFSLWESVNSLLLERPQLRREMKNIEQSLNQLMEFIPD